jgi:hypothetical protein
MEKSKSPYETAAKNAISSETVMMSPQMARTMRAKAHFDRQRPIRQPHVERLKEEMDRGWFLPGTPIWLCVLPSGQEWIINGNHTLEAIGSSDFSVPLTVIRQRVRDQLERLRGAAAKEPIVLLGTPWAKTKVVQLRRRKAA